jgi:hypothetical protein
MPLAYSELLTAGKREHQPFGVKDKLMHWLVIPLVSLPIIPFVLLYDYLQEKQV